LKVLSEFRVFLIKEMCGPEKTDEIFDSVSSRDIAGATRLRPRRPANTLRMESRTAWSAWSTTKAATTRLAKMRCRGMRYLFYRIILSPL
jgi:hypothetical protein